MKNILKASLLCLLILTLSGCSSDVSKKEPHLKYTRANVDYAYHDTTLEDLFNKADLVVMGTVTNGNLTGIKEISANQPVTAEDDIIAEVMVTGLYKGDAGDIIHVVQQYGEAFFVDNGYLKYEGQYLLFLKQQDNGYSLFSPDCRYELKDGKFTPVLNSSEKGEIKSPEELAEFLG